jgi:hypothetical protein
MTVASSIHALLQAGLSHPLFLPLLIILATFALEDATTILVAAGESARLVQVGNHCKGAIFRNGQHYVTPEMERAFAAISDEIPDFYFGRFDARFRCLEDLQQGRGFTIIDVNGAGSEATHIWERQTRLIDAYRGLFQQFRLAFEIGAVNRRRGLKPMSGIALLRCYLTEKKPLSAYL